MSTLIGRDYAPRTLERAARRSSQPAAIKVGMPARTAIGPSPTTTISRTLTAVAIALLLALVLNARAVVHDAEGMPDGLARTVILALGRPALAFAEVTHLTWPRDRLDAALGHTTQPSLPPLLAVAPAATPKPHEGIVLRAAGPSPTVMAKATPPPGPRRGAAQASPVVATTAGATAHLVTPPAARPAPSPPAAPVVSSATPPWRPTARRPLRLLVTGDSLTGYLGPELVNEAAAAGPVRGVVETHNGTGLTRPDFVDWSLLARQQIAAYAPDAVVVMMGGNDFQNMTLPTGQFFQVGAAAWTQEYQRRAAICMRIWSGGGARRVYWLSTPPARARDWAYDDAQINLALQRAAAQVPGVEYLDINGPVTDHGRYADFVRGADGRLVLVREQDGVHLNLAGSTIVAGEVLGVLEREWRLGVAAHGTG